MKSVFVSLAGLGLVMMLALVPQDLAAFQAPGQEPGGLPGGQAPGQQPGQLPGEQPGQAQAEATFEGELVEVDAEGMTLTARNEQGQEMEFQWDAETEVTGSEEGVQGLAGQSGTQVSITYETSGQDRIARRIEVSEEESN